MPVPSLCSDMDECKYVLTTLSAENDSSEVADVIGTVKYNYIECYAPLTASTCIQLGYS